MGGTGVPRDAGCAPRARSLGVGLARDTVVSPLWRHLAPQRAVSPRKRFRWRVLGLPHCVARAAYGGAYRRARVVVVEESSAVLRPAAAALDWRGVAARRCADGVPTVPAPFANLPPTTTFIAREKTEQIFGKNI